ncbi:hypothetical protein [Nannocystis sp.]|uniref:hypothetical protein n=1 Tax=Nannocystis sp. TaxID=1962667 RepID=UPI002420B78A|nr:hypothetical protein [Nannocystis sp.]MBK7826549.1 hypothetical protein [Nannocystis sp.]MBK9754171.1 hypothetical protein [Nannocystis sp.]
MFSSLDCVDLVYTDPAGRTRWLQTDHRRPAHIEAEPELSLIYAALRLRSPRRDFPIDAPPPVLEYRCQHLPPAFLRAAIAAAGAELWTDVHHPFAGVPPDLTAIVRLALAGLATRIARDRGLGRDLAGLAQLEQATPIVLRDADELRHWRAVVELAAFAGELLRARHGGRWILDDEHAALSLAFLAADDPTPIDLIELAIQRVEGDASTSLAALVTAVSGRSLS